jgi:hypothetical protein
LSSGHPGCAPVPNRDVPWGRPSCERRLHLRFTGTAKLRCRCRVLSTSVEMTSEGMAPLNDTDGSEVLRQVQIDIRVDGGTIPPDNRAGARGPLPSANAATTDGTAGQALTTVATTDAARGTGLFALHAAGRWFTVFLLNNPRGISAPVFGADDPAHLALATDITAATPSTWAAAATPARLGVARAADRSADLPVTGIPVGQAAGRVFAPMSRSVLAAFGLPLAWLGEGGCAAPSKGYTSKCTKRGAARASIRKLANERIESCMIHGEVLRMCQVWSAMI